MTIKEFKKLRDKLGYQGMWDRFEGRASRRSTFANWLGFWLGLLSLVPLLWTLLF